jgi:adenosine kinase
MSALISGSIAYDTIMVFEDQFKNHILPEQVHILNVSFLVPSMQRNFGGCAGNIAYNLHLLGGDALPMGTVGQDFAPYAAWMDEKGVSRQGLREIEGTYTAQAFITTDQDDNQITAFHPGAMNFAHENKVSDYSGVTIGMVSPNGRQGMLEHAEQFVAAGIPFIFDAGQGMLMFNGDELDHFAQQATWLAFNDYEAKLMEERTGKTMQEFTEQVKAVIVTRGGEGSSIYTRDGRLDIPCAPVDAVVDPTGCGDAYRGGLLYGLMNGLDWLTTGRIAALLGAIKIESQGPQNHTFTREGFAQRYQQAFDQSLDWS